MERLFAVIDRKLARLLRAAPAPPVWQESWSRLGPTSTWEDRLRVCQAIRDSGTMPEDAGSFLVCWAAEYLANNSIGKPADPLATLNVFESLRSYERSFIDLLLRHGESRLAERFRSDPAEHARRREAGRLFFFKPGKPRAAEDPEWLNQLLRAVADSLVAPRPVTSLTFRSSRDSGYSEVHVSRPSAVDLAWALQVERLRQAFDHIDTLGWYGSPVEAGEGPYVWVEGRFLGHEVFLRVSSTVIEQVEPGPKPRVWERGTT